MGKKAAAAGTGDGSAQSAEIKRVAEVIEELSKKAPIRVAPHLKRVAPYLAMAWVYFLVALPYLQKAFHFVHDFVKSLPEKIIYAALGFAVCFFGGIFPVTIAAVEAWRLCGGSEAMDSLKLLRDEWMKVQEANKEDDAKDGDKDGKADVKQVSPQDLIVRKAQVVLRTVEPEVVSHGLVGLYTGWIGVLAILKIQFAKTVTLGERVGEEVYRHVRKYEPSVSELVPEEYRKWVPVAIRYTVKAVAISIAWWIQRAISAVHSAIRGGRIFGKCLVDFLHEQKLLSVNSEQAYLDEAIGWGVAAAGLIFQFSLGFGVPFPLSLLLWPVQFLEAFIVWSVAAA